MNSLINEKIIVEIDVLSDQVQQNINENLFSADLKALIQTNKEVLLRYLEVALREKNAMLEKHLFEMNYFIKHVTYIDEVEAQIQRKRYGLMKIYNLVAGKGAAVSMIKQTEAPQIQKPIANPEPSIEQEPVEAAVATNVRWDFKKKPITKEGLKRIGKIELTEIVAAKFNMPKTRAKTFVTLMFEEIRLSLVNDEQVWLNDFGNFLIIDKAEREGFNPSTGERLIIPATQVVKFKASARVKESINN
ncbi:HU family DNA-binding protein [Spiroplasma endosymbiont of Crioceris asparagi]|uniref:HU family DNA-binding protein n=1 Tax=Spiroplasma endosymbiont of Crioceris asparagi TaxID=3066286 RepID=UPI0030D15DB9